jgi:predicted ribosome quality control (RQC) complex YloA/Tae2 family protein
VAWIKYSFLGTISELEAALSLNWKEINLILDELNLEGYQIQKAIQSAYDVLCLKLYGNEGAKTLLVSLSPGAVRLHETFQNIPKAAKPLRFAEFLNARIINSRIEEVLQLGDNRIIRIRVRLGEQRFFLYIRLWSNAANLIVTDEDGVILDAMKRLPKKGEVSGGPYEPPADTQSAKEYAVRKFPADFFATLPEQLKPTKDAADLSFNQKIDLWYSREGGALSLDALKEEARRKFEGRIDRLRLSLEKLKDKEADFSSADHLRQYGDIILANLGSVKAGDSWLEAVNFYAPPEQGESVIRIKLDSKKTPAANAEDYYDQFRKAKSGIEEVQREIEKGKKELAGLEETLQALLGETNPLYLHKLLKAGGKAVSPVRKEDAKRPGLSFRRKDWLIMVGRNAAENDALLRRHVRGNDLWLHARDFPGAYVFVKNQPGKSVPLDILLDAGNLAVFYSKGRNNGEADLFYTQVKYLRRAKDGPKGLVIPTQEKNLHIRVEDKRLRDLEECRVGVRG